jgi:hypothetical protein
MLQKKKKFIPIYYILVHGLHNYSDYMSADAKDHIDISKYTYMVV